MLHSYGLLKPCFQPENIARTMRNLVRHRDNHIRSASREVLHDCDQKIQEIADRYTATIFYIMVARKQEYDECRSKV